MEPGTWERLEAIFFEALELPADERGTFVAEACGEDADLRSEVEAVLAAHRSGESAAPAGEPPDRRIGSRVGAYRLEELIGRGGMGDVYRARRADDEYQREVAVKLVRSGLHPVEMSRRLRLERQILARLEHPGIATLLDGGITEEGQPYLVMQFVGGAPITEHVDRHRLPIARRLRLFVDVCRAVQFAHASLVVHRDLKPSNILVTDDGRVRLLDFGIAKLLDPEAMGDAAATESLLLLTPEHAAPEQFLGLPITTATDVYQLGILLYELLTGSKPFVGSGSLELHRAICEQEPTRPSAALGHAGRAAGGDTVSEGDAARARATTPDGLRRRLRGDLDWIVLMALRKEPERRYASVAELADDVERHLDGFPVRARPEGVAYVAGRFVRRHRFGFAAGVGLAASLVALAVTSLRFAATTAGQSRAIAAERDVAVEVSTFLEGLFGSGDPFADSGPRDTMRVRDFLDDGARQVREGLAGQPLVQARLLATLGKANRNLGRFDAAQPLVEEALALRLAALGPDAPEVATSRMELAQVLIARGRHEEAQELLEASIAVFGRDSVALVGPLASAYGVLGGSLQDRARFPEAEAAYRRALALSETDSTLQGARRAEHLSNLATALSQQSKLDEAEALLRRAVALARESLGDDHPTTAGMLNNLGSVLRDRDRLDEAEGPLREALAIRRARFEAPHPAIATSVNNLADLLLAEGDFEGAVPLFRESLELRRAIYGDVHPAVGLGWLNLAAALQRLERRDDALAAYAEARTVFLATVGGGHPVVGALEGNLGHLYHEADEHALALEHLRTALGIRRQSYDEGHPLVLGNLSDIGRCLLDLGRADEAEASLLQALAGLEPQRAQQARLFDSVLERLVRLSRAQGREADAARYEAMRVPPVS